MVISNTQLLTIGKISKFAANPSGPNAPERQKVDFDHLITKLLGTFIFFHFYAQLIDLSPLSFSTCIYSLPRPTYPMLPFSQGTLIVSIYLRVSLVYFDASFFSIGSVGYEQRRKPIQQHKANLFLRAEARWAALYL